MPNDYVFPQDNPDGKQGLARKGGMDIIDYYAAHAPTPPAFMIGVHGDSDVPNLARALAEWAFTYAAAMVKERDRRFYRGGGQ